MLLSVRRPFAWNDGPPCDDSPHPARTSSLLGKRPRRCSQQGRRTPWIRRGEPALILARPACCSTQVPTSTASPSAQPWRTGASASRGSRGTAAMRPSMCSASALLWTPPRRCPMWTGPRGADGLLLGGSGVVFDALDGSTLQVRCLHHHPPLPTPPLASGSCSHVYCVAPCRWM